MLLLPISLVHGCDCILLYNQFCTPVKEDILYALSACISRYAAYFHSHPVITGSMLMSLMSASVFSFVMHHNQVQTYYIPEDFLDCLLFQTYFLPSR